MSIKNWLTWGAPLPSSNSVVTSTGTIQVNTKTITPEEHIKKIEQELEEYRNIKNENEAIDPTIKLLISELNNVGNANFGALYYGISLDPYSSIKEENEKATIIKKYFDLIKFNSKLDDIVNE